MSRKKYGKFTSGSLVLIVSLVILDQISKYLCVSYIPYNTLGIEVLPFFNLVHVYNYGAAFSMFADYGGIQRHFLSGIALILIILFAVLLYRTQREYKWQRLSYMLFIAGALGNLIDRIFLGYVVDFLLFYLKGDDGRIIWAYPAFNVADIAVCCGAALMVIISVFSREKQDNDKQQSN